MAQEIRFLGQIQQKKLSWRSILNILKKKNNAIFGKNQINSKY
jgi:hypothetical protein